MEIKREFALGIHEFQVANPEVRLVWQPSLQIPGSSTPTDSWIIQSAVKAWEEVEGTQHEPILETSGATDTNILRNRGIPTARVGMPKVLGIEDFELGMNTVSLVDMKRLTEVLIRIAIDTCK